jgi:hypothetical protein
MGQEKVMEDKTETWCYRDEHNLFELFVDFNEWVESDEAIDVREANGIDGLSQPSKAFLLVIKKPTIKHLENIVIDAVMRC